MKQFEQGSFKSVVLVPQPNKREKIFGEIVSALNKKEFYVMRPKYSKNSVYTLLRKLKTEANIEATFGVTETNQFAIYAKTETPKTKKVKKSKKAKVSKEAEAEITKEATLYSGTEEKQATVITQQ